MSPSSPSLNVSYGCLGDAVHNGNGVLMLAFGKSRSNVGNSLRREFRSSVSGPAVRCAVQLLVGVVVFMRVVTEITNAVIHRIAIVVANIGLWRTRADECGHNECMNKKRLWFGSVLAELHGTVPIFTCSRLQNYRVKSLCFFGASVAHDYAIVAYKVARKVVNWPKCWGGDIHVSDYSVPYAKLRG